MMSEVSLKREIKKLKECMSEKDDRIHTLEKAMRGIYEIKNNAIILLSFFFGVILSITTFFSYSTIWKEIGIGFIYDVNEKIDGISHSGEALTLLLSFFVILYVIWSSWFKLTLCIQGE
jgi:hypothetical protein